MKQEVEWITDALSSKNLAREMTHYRIQDKEIRATDGRLTAGHPFPHDGKFLVPGSEFEKLVKRLPKEASISVAEDSITLHAGKSRGRIKTLPIEEWDYPGVDEDGWEEAPEGLVDVLRDLTPFVSDNATQPFALGVSLHHGYAFATNNIALAGVRCDALGDISAILPVWAVNFVVDREEGLAEWAWTDHYVAFRWENGAWMRAQLIDATFPEQAMRMIVSAEQAVPSQAIENDFREAFARTVALCNDYVMVGPNAISGVFGEAAYQDGVTLATLDKDTMWSSRALTPVIKCATHWEPKDWPQRTVFKGDRLFGFIMGRTA